MLTAVVNVINARMMMNVKKIVTVSLENVNLPLKSA